MSREDADEIPEEVELVPVPMDRQTRARLVRFADAIGKPPARAAHDLLRDLLDDPAFWEAAEIPQTIN